MGRKKSGLTKYQGSMKNMCMGFDKIDFGANRHWCVTIYDMEFKNRMDEKCPEEIRYLITGYEICPDTGRPHYQTYMEFHKLKPRFSTVQKILGVKAHCEVRWATRDAARTYCKKDEKWTEYGKWIAGQGHRTDVAEKAQRLMDGESIKDIAIEDPDLYCRYRNGFKDFGSWGQEVASRKFRQVEVQVIWGDTGTNKTRRALYPNGDDTPCEGFLLDAPDHGERLWFDGYDGQETLILDDFYGGIKYSKLLRLLDGHQFRCPIKGSFTYARWTKVIITSNKSPEEWYSFGMTPALERRIDTVNGDPYCPEVLRGNTEDSEYWSMD